MPKIGKNTGATGDSSRSETNQVTDSLGVSGNALIGGNLTVLGTVTSGGGRVADPVTHDFVRDGWTGFQPVTITNDSPQVFVTAVDATTGRGTVTGTGSGHGNHRVAYLKKGTESTDSVVTSLIWGPTGHAWDGTNAQQGHIHRAREISPGLWEAIVVWTSIVNGGTYHWLHCNTVRWDGTTLTQGASPAAFEDRDDDWIDYRLPIVGRQRRQVVSDFFNDYLTSTPSRIHLQVGDLVQTQNIGDATYVETSIALTAVSMVTGVLTVQEPTTLSIAAYTAIKDGTLNATGVDLMKRWCPFWLSTRVIGGTTASVTVEGKRWRARELEPDWTDDRVQRGAVTPDADTPTAAIGPGRCGLWTGHFHDNSGGAWGAASFTKLR